MDCNITLGCSPFPSTSVGALGLFTFFPQCTVHNMCISELGVPVYSSLLLTIWLSVSGVLLTFWLSVSGVLLIYFIVCIRGPFNLFYCLYQGSWDPREAAFAVLNQETGPDIHSVYMTVAADLVIAKVNKLYSMYIVQGYPQTIRLQRRSQTLYI